MLPTWFIIIIQGLSAGSVMSMGSKFLESEILEKLLDIFLYRGSVNKGRERVFGRLVRLETDVPCFKITKQFCRSRDIFY